MYNEERKRQYLKEKSARAILSSNIYSEFALAQSFEERLGRDLCEWDSGEIIDFYRYHATPSIQSLIQINNMLEGYTTWCIANGLVKDNQNHYSEIKSAQLINCIDYEKLASLIITREQLLKDISDLPNDSDKFLILGIFEGIPTVNEVLFNVKLQDVNAKEGTIALSNGKTRKFSPELIKYALRAGEEDGYTNMKTQKTYQLYDTGTLIKPIIYIPGRVLTRPMLVINRRFTQCRIYMGWPEITTATVRDSGRIHYLREKIKETGMPLREYISVNREEVEDLFGRIQNLTAYVAIYGKIIENNK